MTTALATLTKEMATQETALTSTLPPNMDAKRFMRTAINAISTHAQADKLMKADRKSLFSACQKPPPMASS